MIRIPKLSRRAFAALPIATLAAPIFPSNVASQDNAPSGALLFVKEGDVWQWTSGDGAKRVVEDGSALDARWGPQSNYLVYVRDGGSFADLVLANRETGNTQTITDNESDLEKGSQEYVDGCVMVRYPSWPSDNVMLYCTDQDASPSTMDIWILNPDEEGSAYPASNDLSYPGSVEHLTVDEDVLYCAYTLRPEGELTSEIVLRDINSGTSYLMMEGAQGAFDPAISADGKWIIGSRREHGVSDLWLMNRESEELIRLTEKEQAMAACWSPDENWVAYIKMSDFDFEIRAFPIDVNSDSPAGKSIQLVEKGSIDSTSGLSWTDD